MGERGNVFVPREEGVRRWGGGEGDIGMEMVFFEQVFTC